MKEKTLQSQNKVVKAGAGYVIGNYLLKGITFLSAPIFTRLMTTEEFGNFGTYISYESIFYIILGLALHSSINNAKYKYKEKFEEYVSSIVLLTTVSAFAWLILANVFYDSYGRLLDLTRPIVNILVFHCFATAMLQFFNSYVSLNYSVKSFLKLTSVNAISNLVLSVLLMLTVFSKDRYLGRIVGTAVPLFLIAVYIVRYFFRKSRPVFHREYWKYGVRYSLPIIPHGISQVVLSSFDKIMIKNMSGAAESGIYNFAFTINALIKVVANSLDNVWKPWLYEKMDAKDYGTIRKQAGKYAYGMALFTVLVMMVSPEIIKILGAREYWESTACVIPLVLGGYFSFLYTLPVLVEYFYEKTRYIAVGTTLAAVLNVILNYIFIQRYGYIAAAYTTMVTYFLYFVFHYVLAARIHGKSLFSGLQLFGICGGITVMGFIALMLEKHLAVRFGLELVIGLYSLYWADRNFNLFSLLRKKIRR
ncbi:MAG: lipopolysaccharide biosynthesis protein [Acetatifactor sp.]